MSCSLGIGSLVESIADKAGAPEWVGDTLGIVAAGGIIVGACITGNPTLALAAAPDLVENVADLVGDAASSDTPRQSVAGGYPPPDDAAGWAEFVKARGAAEFRRVADNPQVVAPSVFSDPAFVRVLQRKESEETNYYAAISDLDRHNDNALRAIIRG
ncbi:MAG: hypothetical protein V2A73_07285 [Pseudomonadota bacterium]